MMIFFPLLESCGNQEKGMIGDEFPVVPTQFVNPFIGTGGHGHTHPAASVPFGMVQLGPDSRKEGWDGCSGYHFSDSSLYGFSHTHLSGTGVSDYSDVLVTPITPMNAHLEHGDTAGLVMEKSTELAEPGYYSVMLNRGGIQAEMTATERVGIHKYTFENDAPILSIDLGYRDKVLDAELVWVDSVTIEGYRVSSSWAEKQSLYFRMEFSQPTVPPQVFGNGEASENEDGFRLSGEDAGVVLHFGEGVKEVMVKVALSATDYEGARKNLQAADHWDFELYRTQAKDKWNAELGDFEVNGPDSVLTNFYTGLYHAFLVPNLFSDADGRFRGMDDQIHQADNTRIYTIFSLWDTFRAAHPLYTLTQKQRTNEFIKTFLSHFETSGRLPVWELAANETDCMIGYHAVSVIADAWQKGIRDFDTEKALEAMIKTADFEEFGLADYKKYGFIRAEEEAESVSKTLEYAYDDWCIASMARAMGDHDASERFFKRAQHWKNVFDDETNFMRGRMNGLWFSPFDPSEVNFQFTEANSWQYSLFVPHDINTLIGFMGGPRNFENYLDSLFSASSQTTGREQADITGLIGQYAHGNEPSHHMAYLYNFVGKPWKTQEKVHEIMANLYTNAPDGLSGNEDCGQMSAWYVFSALGFYPVTPGAGTYVLGTPALSRAKIRVGNQRNFEMVAHDLSPQNFYIQKVLVNGEEWPQSWITHKLVDEGAKIEFFMGPEPNEKWAHAPENCPSTQIKSYITNPVPQILADSRTFSDEIEVKLKVAGPDQARIYYTTDGSEPKVEGNIYTLPLKFNKTTQLKVMAYRPDRGQSPTISAELVKIDDSRKIKLNSTYANQYNGGGDNALIDGIRGGKDFRTGTWQGYRENLNFVVDLGKQKDIYYVSLGCLQDVKSWIVLPRQVSVSVSEDGLEWEKMGTQHPQIKVEEEGSLTYDFKFYILTRKRPRYIKVEAAQYGTMPEWHIGAGGKSWIFADELVISEN